MLASENRVLGLQTQSKQVPAGLPMVEACVPDLGLSTKQQPRGRGRQNGAGVLRDVGLSWPCLSLFLSSPVLSLQLFPPLSLLLCLSLVQSLYCVFFFTEIFILCSTVTCLFVSSLVS